MVLDKLNATERWYFALEYCSQNLSLRNIRVTRMKIAFMNKFVCIIICIYIYKLINVKYRQK